MALPVLIINRDCDADRWRDSLAAARAAGVEPERIAAVDAHAPGFRLSGHADLIRPHFWGRDTIKPGAVGCFLSHRRAWARVVEAGWPAALVLEDDADLMLAPDLPAAVLAETGGDVVFANDRLASWARVVEESAPWLPVDRVLGGIARQGGPGALGLKPAPGADAYAVSRGGAERLLAATADLGIVCGVDWAMIWLALGADLPVPGLPELGVLTETLGAPARRIAASALTVPVARLRGGPSVIMHRIERPIADLLRH